MKNTLAKIFACLLCFLLTKAGAQNVSDLLHQGMSLQRAVIPLYPIGSFKPSIIVRVDRAFMDYQHKGFFRIGFLPIGVLDGVTIEARDTAAPFASLACLRRWLGSKAGQRIEMRRVKFLISPGKSLEAGLARCGAGDRWELLGGVRFVSGDGEVQAPQATLELAGPRGAQVILETTPRTTNTFLASALTFNDSRRPRLTEPSPSK
ncbi:MAG: hypothetical protein ABSA83_21670 [Verrucomicrobiota bacterium]|jgi:hypothetical protein